MFEGFKKLLKSKPAKENKTSKGVHKRDENREMGIITYAFVALFIAMIVYLGIFTQFKSHDVINNPYNKRQSLLEDKYIRGTIYSAGGDVLAQTLSDSSGNTVRQYPYGRMFAHAVGYSTHGVLGVESIENFSLLECSTNAFDRISNDLKGEKNHGDNVVTTLNTAMQIAAYEALGDNKGAVFAINAKTGEIMTVVSKPDFDPNEVDQNWEILNADTSDSPLLNRALLGQYPPGSTFKIVTALEYMKETHGNTSDYEFDCNGSFTYDGITISCYHQNKHGEVDFTESFAKSCNSSFANISSGLDINSFSNTCTELLFGQELPLPYSYSKGVAGINADSDTAELLQAGIGQGTTLMSPAHMALITAAAANNGILMKPYVVSKITNYNGADVYTAKPEQYKTLIDEDYAGYLCEMMRQVVLDGTASKAIDTRGYIIGGKTGSAEFSSDKSRSHAWFTGYAQDDENCIAIAVIVEDGGSGGETAVPIAKSVFDAFYNR